MKDLLEVALAGFVHDWGKLFQRAEWPLTAQAERMTEMLCPARSGYATHKHVLWTNDILSGYLNWLPEGLDGQRLVKLASEHHRPSGEDDWLITEADWLASGHDRREQSEEGRRDFKSVPLASVFSTLSLTDMPKSPSILLPQAVKAEVSLLPLRGWTERRLVSEYRAVAEQLTRQLGGWSRIPEARVCAAVAGLSERYLSTIPASTIDAVCDVSLHDHGRLVAAFASALFLYHRENGTLTESAIRDRSIEKFLFLGGDLSGIQGYLFDVPTQGTKGVARVFRARSFFLSRLTQAAAVKLLLDVGLPPFNNVMDAGGRFLLLLPNLPMVRERIARLRAEVDRWMVSRFGGMLTLNLDASVSASGQQFMGESFLALFSRLQHAAEVAKRRKLAAWLCPEGRWSEGAQLLDYVHGRERQDEDFDRDRQLGRWLPDATYVGLWPAAPAGRLDPPLQLLDLQLQFFRGEPPAPALVAEAADFAALQSEDDRPADGASSWITTQRAANYIPRQTEEDARILGERLGPTEEATTEDEIEGIGRNKLATFEHLAILAQRSAAAKPGLAAIGCLKADVDRLGMLFGEGLRGEVSIGRTATLSRQLDSFFKAHLQARFSEPDSPYRQVYTIFAGGDDLLLIGPWPTMFKLADDLNGWFREFTANNPDVTISAGLVLGRARVPVSALAAAADKALEDAKEAGRNRISLFREILDWDQYRLALEDGERLDRMISEGDNRTVLKLSPGFVYRLLQYARSAARVGQAMRTEEAVANKRPLAPGALRMADLRAELTWRSHLMYDLHRNIRQKLGQYRTEAVNTDLNWLESLLIKEMKPSSERIGRLKIAATYSLYRNRGG